jgi:hypothetical protein
MIKSRDMDTRVLAAAALCRLKPSRLLVRHLLDGVKGSNVPLAVLSAMSLSAMSSHMEEGIDVMVELFRKVDNAQQLNLAIAFRAHGTKAAHAVHALSSVMFNPAASPTMKYACAKTVAIIAGPFEDGRHTLEDAIGSGDPPLIRGTIEGLHAKGSVPSDLVQRVTPWLSADDAELRCAAAESLALIGRSSSPALVALIARIGQESNEDASFAVVRALANLEEEAFPRLIDVILEHNALRTPHAAMAISRMGDAGIRLIAELLPDVQDVRLAQVMLHVIHEMGVRAAPVVPVLATLITQVEDDEVALMILLAIHSTGSGSASAVPALIQCVTRGPEENRSVARLALWNAGPDAIPSIERARAVADGQAKERLSHVLAGMRAPDAGEFVRYESIPDPHLRVFAAMCELLSKSKATSYAKMSAELRSGNVSQAARRKQDGVSASQLRAIIAEIADANDGAKILDTKEGGRTCRLTPEGVRAAREVRACLQHRRRRRGEAAGGQ